VLLSLGVSSDGLPLRLGVRDGNTSDSPETPVAIEECVALELDGVRGSGADSKAIFGKDFTVIEYACPDAPQGIGSPHSFGREYYG
jgi:hypothetical protein